MLHPTRLRARRSHKQHVEPRAVENSTCAPLKDEMDPRGTTCLQDSLWFAVQSQTHPRQRQFPQGSCVLAHAFPARRVRLEYAAQSVVEVQPTQKKDALQHATPTGTVPGLETSHRQIGSSTRAPWFRQGLRQDMPRHPLFINARKSALLIARLLVLFCPQESSLHFPSDAVKPSPVS